MRKLSLAMTGALLAFVLAAPSSTFAKGGGWKAAGGAPPGYSHGDKLGWGSASYPPGFTHGRKRGWHGRRVPPGWSHGRR